MFRRKNYAINYGQKDNRRERNSYNTEIDVTNAHIRINRNTQKKHSKCAIPIYETEKKSNS